MLVLGYGDIMIWNPFSWLLQKAHERRIAPYVQMANNLGRAQQEAFDAKWGEGGWFYKMFDAEVKRLEEDMKMR